ncbi:hypothetical protein JW859_04395 [bacterium]|nr:hypothetical protein [bacterium]
MMNIQRVYVVSGLLASFLGFCTLTAGCQGSGTISVEPDSARGFWQADVAEVEKAPVPDGVEAELFTELQAELVRVIKETAAKDVATPPTGNYNAVTRLVVTGNDADGWRLEWDYVNTGDYNLDGMVNVSDLTPIGQNFNAASGDANWNQAQWADGNGDGMITVSDITPIGQNFLAYIDAFAIYGADYPAGTWTQVGTFDLPVPFDPTQPLSYALAANDFDFYRVVPRDGYGTEGVASGASMYTLSPPVVELGTDTQWDSATIGTSGASLNSPILTNGLMTLIIPSGALDANVDFAFGANDGQVTRDGVPLDGQLIYITASEYVRFDEQVRLAYPLPDEDGALALAFRVLDGGGLMPLTMPEIDRNADFAYFDINIAFPEGTGHQTSDLPVLWTDDAHLFIFEFVFDAAVTEEGPKLAYDTGFQPTLDCFTITELGGWSANNFAYAMGSFACWYFRNYADSLSPLAIEFNDPQVQETIARRAVISVSLGAALKDPPAAADLSLEENYALVKTAMRNSSGPVMVSHHCPSSSSSSGYLKIAYAYSFNNLLVTEPDTAEPGVAYDITEADTYLRLMGTDDLPMYEPFENILLDATDNPPFGGSNKATVNITAPALGATVGDNTTQISGTITSGDYLVEELYVLNTGLLLEDPTATSVPISGEFSVEVPLQPGLNEFMFITRAAIGYYESLGKYKMMTVPNNQESGAFWLTLEPENALPLQIELTWAEPVGTDCGEYMAAEMLVPTEGNNHDPVGYFSNHGTLEASPYAAYEEFAGENKVVHYVDPLYQGVSDYVYEYSIYSWFKTDNDSDRTWSGGSILVYRDGALLKTIEFDNTLYWLASDFWPTQYHIFDYDQNTNVLTVVDNAHWWAAD